MNRRRFLAGAMGAAALGTSHARAEPLAPDTTVALHCLGHLDGKRRLAANPAGASVLLLADRRDASPLASLWRVAARGTGAVALRCLATSAGEWWLMGLPSWGSVRLDVGDQPSLPEAIWQPRQDAPGVITLRCAAAATGSGWLDGRTKTGTVGLAPSLAFPYTGTRWEVVSPQTT